MSLVWIQPSELEKRHPVIKWAMVLLVNKRGGVISVIKPRAEALVKAGTHIYAPDGVTAGMYLPQYDSQKQDEIVTKTPKSTKSKRKSASSKKSK